jgi:hypothetical protein
MMPAFTGQYEKIGIVQEAVQLILKWRIVFENLTSGSHLDWQKLERVACGK